MIHRVGVCQACNALIEQFNGSGPWTHIGPTPRHIATPMELPTRGEHFQFSEVRPTIPPINVAVVAEMEDPEGNLHYGVVFRRDPDTWYTTGGIKIRSDTRVTGWSVAPDKLTRDR